MDVKVKTLDGLTHEFSVPDHSTVLQFKEIIREKMDIAIDRQRLLFQGRVLQDELLLSSYDVSGNVMHLVTRMPPLARPATETTTEREENSDINRDQIRNILSDVFNNIGDLNNPMGVSVNNEGNRMDITLNIPTQNRLSLSRLRQNYVYVLQNQARTVLNHVIDPTGRTPIPDRDRLRQADPYDIGPNENRFISVTSQPLPISSLADMIFVSRALWHSADPQLELWESVLRRESDVIEEIEMQRIHDSVSRFVHIFAHILHILSDYLVEFQPNTTIPVPVPQTNVETASTGNDATTSTSVDDNSRPLTGACGESAMAAPTPANDSPHTTHTSTTAAPAAAPAPADTTVPDVALDVGDRSHYLYVFSEMPAQIMQVRLDVDSNMPGLRTTPVVPSATTQSHTNVQSSTTATDSTPTPDATVNNDGHVNTESTDAARARSRRRFPVSGIPVENLFRTTITDTMMGSNVRPQMATGSRTIRSSPHFMDHVDPYLRCQSRHFQHPSNLRSGTVISSFGGITLHDNLSRPRTTNIATTATTNRTTASTPMGNVQSQGTDTDPMRTLISGLMNSIFPGPGDVPRPAETTAVTEPASSQANIPQPVVGDINRIFQSLAGMGGANFNAPLVQLFPEMMNNQELDPDNFLTNRIISLAVSKLTLTDFMAIIRGQYTSINQLRGPLQDLLLSHQREAGSREMLLNHIVSDLEFFNRAYFPVFEKLRSGNPIENLSEVARNSFNLRLDIFKTIKNINRFYFRMMIDMILRSPTNQGFGAMLMYNLTIHHNSSLALIDIICNNNDELRQFLVKSFLDSLLQSMNQSTDANMVPTNQNGFGMDMIFNDINLRLFQRPENLTYLKNEVLNNFAVYFTENGSEVIADSVDEFSANGDSIEDMVTNLSENIIDGVIITELERPQATLAAVDPCVLDQNENGAASWCSVVPPEWVAIISRDATLSTATENTATVPFSDAYVSGMPPKRRKVIINQRQKIVQASSDMMQDCIDQAIKSAGLPDSATLASAQPSLLITDLKTAFQELVSDCVQKRLTDESLNYPADRFPNVELNFKGQNRQEKRNKE